MPRYRPGGRLPDSVPVTAPFTLPRTSPRHRSDTVRTVNPDEPVGVAPRGLGPATPSDRPANRPAVRRGGWWHSSRAPVPLTPREPARFPPQSPEGDSDRLGSPVPVGVALSGTGHTIRERITPGQELILNSQGSPQKFSRYPQETPRSSTVHAQGYAQPGAATGPAADAARRGHAVDAGARARLNGARDLAGRHPPRRDHHHFVVHVDHPRARRSRPPGGFFEFSGLVRTGARS